MIPWIHACGCTVFACLRCLSACVCVWRTEEPSLIFLALYSNTQASKRTKGLVLYDKQHKVKLLTKTITSAEQEKPGNYTSSSSLLYTLSVFLYKDLIYSKKATLKSQVPSERLSECAEMLFTFVMSLPKQFPRKRHRTHNHMKLCREHSTLTNFKKSCQKPVSN